MGERYLKSVPPTPADKRGRSSGPEAFSSAALETVRREFEELGLTDSEARVLLALLRVGSGTATDLARLAGVPRQRVYRMLEVLSARGLVEELPGRVATWGSPGRDAVIDRLIAAQEARFHDLQARAERAREILVKAAPASSTPALPYVHLLRAEAEVGPLLTRLQAQTQFEVLAFVRAPCVNVGQVDSVEIADMARGVSYRGLYEATLFAGSDARLWRHQVDTYVEAGEQARIADSLPVKLLIFDRRVSLIGLQDPVVPGGFAMPMLIEHAGFSALVAAAFEHYWAAARPYPNERGAEAPPDAPDS